MEKKGKTLQFPTFCTIRNFDVEIYNWFLFEFYARREPKADPEGQKTPLQVTKIIQRTHSCRKFAEVLVHLLVLSILSDDVNINTVEFLTNPYSRIKQSRTFLMAVFLTRLGGSQPISNQNEKLYHSEEHLP